LGQQAPLEEKTKWDNDFAKRKKIKTILDTSIPEFSVRISGTTSIDITKLGIDKAYGIRELQNLLRISTNEMIFIGDALFAGGNDYPVEAPGVVGIPVRVPSETKPVTKAIIACLDPDRLSKMGARNCPPGLDGSSSNDCLPASFLDCRKLTVTFLRGCIEDDGLLILPARFVHTVFHVFCLC
jgi:hypothetical protein